MTQATQRLRRYLDGQLEECRTEDVERRIEELGALEDAIGPRQTEAELDVLSTLVDAGLADGYKDGRWKTYRATNRAVALVTVLEGSIEGKIADE